MSAGGWRYASASVPGTAHLSIGRKCDDACRCEIVTDADGREILVAAAADGAGSAKLGAVGSRIACQSIIEQVRAWLRETPDLRRFNEDIAVDWLDGIRETIAAEAGDSGSEMRDLATTLLLAIVSYDAAIFWQIGDGGIVVSDEAGGWPWVSWPQHGLFASETYFVTDPGARQQLCCSMAHQPVREIAIFTDGLERLLLDHAKKCAQAPAFEKMLQPLRASDAEGKDETLSVALDRYLRSPAVASRTDDDVSLIIATRNSAPAAT